MVPAPRIGIIVSSLPTLKWRQSEQTLEYYSKYMRFGNVDPDTAASVATSAVHAAVDATASNTTENDCTRMVHREETEMQGSIQ